MASSRRTYDTDTITLRTVFARQLDNGPIPALRCLTSDGTGGTFWAIPSTIGILPSFNQITTSVSTFVADLSYNNFSLLAPDGGGVGMAAGSNAGSNETYLYAKCFQTFDISGDNTLNAFSNNYLSPTVTLAGTSGITIRADPQTQTIFFDGTNALTLLSTGYYGFTKQYVIENASTITPEAINNPGFYISADSPSTVLNWIGAGDILLSTNTTQKAIYVSISTFTSEGYLALSGEAFSTYNNVFSTLNAGSVSLSSVNFSTVTTENLYGNSVGILCNTPQYPLDVAGVANSYNACKAFGVVSADALTTTLFNCTSATLSLTGTYVVNLCNTFPTTNYAVNVSPISLTPITPTIALKTNNSFTITTYSGGSLQNSAFDFSVFFFG